MKKQSKDNQTKLRITVHLAYTGYCWRVYCGDKIILCGPLVHHWKLETIIKMSLELYDKTNKR
mgnify:CR=1 FL=1